MSRRRRELVCCWVRFDPVTGKPIERRYREVDAPADPRETAPEEPRVVNRGVRVLPEQGKLI